MKRLADGDVAPVFSVKDTFGKTVSFDGPRDRPLLVAFLRYAACPFCNLAIHRLTVEYPILQSSGIDVMAFIQSSAENIRTNIYENHAETPPFPIIPRQTPDVYARYDVNPSLDQAPTFLAGVPAWLNRVKKGGLGTLKIDGNLFLAPALFMISREGTILFAKYKSNLYDHALFTEIYDAAASDALL